MGRGNPAYVSLGERTEPLVQQISYCIKIGYAVQAILIREREPEVVAELIEILTAAGAIKHIAQQRLDKE